ncbi:MAG: hypothetical protein IT423_06230, partial [Pirellulaceae bacterium]|nr:hypothetical protein [Pirellulaceae bacterium]
MSTTANTEPPILPNPVPMAADAESPQPKSSLETLQRTVSDPPIADPLPTGRLPSDVTADAADATDTADAAMSSDAMLGSQRAADLVPGQPRTRRRWWSLVTAPSGFAWNLVSLMVWLAVIAAIPILQLASLGYLLRAAANLSSGQPWRTALPGLQAAGRLLTFAMLAGLLWLPVLLVTDLSYSVQLLRPGTTQAAAWRAGAFVVACVWLTWITWAAMRGGRWWHVLWPAPLKFVKTFWRPSA